MYDWGWIGLAWRLVAGGVMAGQKERTQRLLFEHCIKSGELEFDNELVRTLCDQTGFKNQFDVTKVDNSRLLPDDIKEEGYCVVHLGKGRHRWVPAVNHWYHALEPIAASERIVWPYRPSILNNTDDSESHIISLAFNQRIIHDFLFGDIAADPKIYMSRRTKISHSYQIGNVFVDLDRLQMEMDATFELNGDVVVVEGKNGFPKDFAVYQLFHPFLDYHRKEIPGVRSIEGCYLAKKVVDGQPVLRLYRYAFDDPRDITSLRLRKKAEYVLEVRDS